jgi:hypothetical protein
MTASLLQETVQWITLGAPMTMAMAHRISLVRHLMIGLILTENSTTPVVILGLSHGLQMEDLSSVAEIVVAADGVAVAMAL